MAARRNKPGSTEIRPFIRLGADASDVLEDPELVKDWDDEELIRGRRRSANGSFNGVEPKVVPLPVYRELWKRTLDTAMEGMRNNLCEAVDVIVNLAKDPAVPPKDRIHAATYIVDRVLGPLAKSGVGAKASFTDPETGAKWETALEVAIVNGFDDDDDE